MPFLNEAIFPLIVEKVDVTLSRTVFHNPLHVPVIDVRRFVTLSLKTFHAPVNAFFSPDQKVSHFVRASRPQVVPDLHDAVLQVGEDLLRLQTTATVK
jgi:hypothetical protein